MGDESEWKKLPIEEKIQHKQWKARVEGYDEALKVFQLQDDPKSPEFAKYLGLLKKIVLDNNAIAQEKGLETVLSFVENAACAGKSAGDVCNALVTKCLMAPRQKTKECAIKILLMYIEIEKQDIVQEELLNGLKAKQPKTVVGSLQTFKEALSEFGTKVITIKPLVKEFPRLIEDRDKGVRDESKALVIEMFRWVGSGLRSQFANVKQVHLDDLDAEIANLSPEKAQPTRFLKSQQNKVPARSAEKDCDAGPIATNSVTDGGEDKLDPYDLADALNLLSKIPTNFYEKIEEKKWQERRDVLDAVEKLAAGDMPKFEAGDYADLMRALLKVIGKDTNVMLVATAARIVTQLAKGLRKKFQPYASQTVKVCLEKFKEKKMNVVSALRDTIDNAFYQTNYDANMEEILAALGNKNPTIKAETALFLSRVFRRETAASMNKKLLKQLTPPLVSIINDTVPEVRDAACEAVGTLMKVVTEKTLTPLLGNDIDTHKMAKVKEHFEKVVLESKSGEAPSTSVANSETTSKADANRPKTAPSAAGKKGPTIVSRPSTAAAGGKKGSGTGATKAPSGKVVAGGGGKKGAAEKKAPGADSLPTESVLSDEAVDDKATSMLGEACLTQLSNVNWKERLAGVEIVEKFVKDQPGSDVPVQVMVKTLGKKPGFKDNNFNVLKQKFELVQYMAQNCVFTKVSADACLEDTFDKVGDIKTGESAKSLLTSMAEACSLEYVGIQLAQAVFNLKNPKNQAEALNWLSQAIKEFGLKISAKELIKYMRTGYQASNASVRTAAINLTVTLYLYMGDMLRQLLQDEKPALLTVIDAEIEKIRGEKPPAPIRGLKGRTDATDGEGNEEDGDMIDAGGIGEEDVVTRVDITNEITPALLDLLGSSAWKERQEGLNNVQSIFTKSPFICGDYHELLTALLKLCGDSNKILGKVALGLCDTLIKAISKSDCKNHFKSLFPSLTTSLGDSKPQIRQAAVVALNSLADKITFYCVAESELVADVYKAESPLLRAELTNWFCDRLTIVNNTKGGAKKLSPELRNILPTYYACFEDRNPDVRKKANEAIVPFMTTFGYDAMVRALSKVRPASKDTLKPLLDKAREQLPASTTVAAAPVPTEKSTNHTVDSKPSKKSAAQAKVDEDDTEAPSRPSTASSKRAKSKTGSAKDDQNSKKNKESEETPTGPLLSPNSNKNQRFNDEKKRKILKWDFESPTKEHKEQLQQLFSAQCSPELSSALFHSDFKQQIKAIEMLNQFLEQGEPRADVVKAHAQNLDLILKWMVFRFFETNPSVLIRGLDYLKKVFQILTDEQYTLHDIEAMSFIPFLVVKAGDPKENIRKDVRSLFKLICNVHPPAKFFIHLMEGIKSKVAKQRQECLEELGDIISNYGLQVCQPTPAVAFKAIATQIGDRDSGVRTACLNTLVQAYNIVGEQIYKMIGNIAEKDRSMLEERIKRTGQLRSEPEAPPVNSATITRPSKGRESQAPASQHSNAVSQIQAAMQAARGRPPNHGEFQLVIDDEMEVSKLEMPNLIQMDSDLKDIYRPVDKPTIKIPHRNGSFGVHYLLQRLLETRPQSPQNALKNAGDASSAITMVMTQISATDSLTSMQALAQIDVVIQDPDKHILLLNYVDQMVMMITMQFKLVLSKHLEDSDCSQEQLIKLIKCLLATLVSLSNNRTLARELARDCLKELFQTLINVMLNDRIAVMTDGDQVVRSINVLLARLISSCNRTRVLCGLLRLLHECVHNENLTSKYCQLVMRCIWKITKELQSANTIKDYSLEAVLIEAHLFFKSFPSDTWKTKKSDVPLRTIKTILHTLCNIKGSSILQHLDPTIDKEESELESYLLKSLKSKPNSQESELPSTGSISKQNLMNNQDEIVRIFNKISSKELTREGLNELYDFLQAHPDIDLKPYFMKTSQFFQCYISQGMKNIEMERARAHAIKNAPQSSYNTKTQMYDQVDNQKPAKDPLTVNKQSNEMDQSISGPVNPQIFMDRLKAVRKQFGLDSSVINSAHEDEDVGAGVKNSGHPETISELNPQQNIKNTDPNSKTSIQSTFDASTSDRTVPTQPPDPSYVTAPTAETANQPSISHTELLDLKRRLEKIKNQQK